MLVMEPTAAHSNAAHMHDLGAAHAALGSEGGACHAAAVPPRQQPQQQQAAAPAASGQEAALQGGSHEAEQQQDTDESPPLQPLAPLDLQCAPPTLRATKYSSVAVLWPAAALTLPAPSDDRQAAFQLQVHYSVAYELQQQAPALGPPSDALPAEALLAQVHAACSDADWKPVATLQEAPAEPVAVSFVCFVGRGWTRMCPAQPRLSGERGLGQHTW
jgi:hypothetical protein